MFSIYKEKNSPLIYIVNHNEFKILGKNMVTLDVPIDSKSNVINFYNVFYIPELHYNLLLIDIIDKAGYLILA